MSRREHWGLLLACCAVGLLGCTEPNPYLDLDSSSSGSSGGTSSSTSTGPEPGTSSSTGASTSTGTQDESSSGLPPPLGCADMGMECVPAAPEGFMGPFGWLEHELDGGARPSCPAPFDEPLVEAFSDVSAPAATCDCSCGSFEGASCAVTGTLRHHAGGVCGGAPTETVNLVVGCNQVPGWAGGSLFLDVPAMTGGSCDPMPVMDVDPAVFLTRHLACGGSFEAMDCAAGELCAPPPSDPLAPRWCVWQAGDVPCPEGPYASRTLLHQTIDDTRGCEPCTCDDPTGPCPNSVALLSTNMGCSMSPGALLGDTCLATPALIFSTSFGAGTPSGACTPAVVVPTGDAAGGDPVTFCCTP